MSGKSQRKLSRSRRGKSRQGSPDITAQRQPISQTYKPSPQPEVSAPSASVSTPRATLTTQYPYIAPELRRIGILAGVILVILVVLVLVLS